MYDLGVCQVSRHYHKMQFVFIYLLCYVSVQPLGGAVDHHGALFKWHYIRKSSDTQVAYVCKLSQIYTKVHNLAHFMCLST